MPESKELFSESSEAVSKSQRRRDALELKSLARDLIAMAAPRLARVPLDEELRAASRRGATHSIQRRPKTPTAIRGQAAQAHRSGTDQASTRSHRKRRAATYGPAAPHRSLARLPPRIRRSRSERTACRYVTMQMPRSSASTSARPGPRQPATSPPRRPARCFALLREMDEAAPLPALQSKSS